MRRVLAAGAVWSILRILPVEAQALDEVHQQLSQALFERLGFGIAYALGNDDPRWYQSKATAEPVACMTDVLAADMPAKEAARLIGIIRSPERPSAEDADLIQKLLDIESDAERKAQVRSWVRKHCPAFERALLDTKMPSN